MIVHSPLVGPSTATPLAAALDGRGWTASVPDLRAAIGSPGGFLLAATSAAAGCDVLVGHSGAGAFLPALAGAVDPAATVFVDAVVPGDGPTFEPSAGFARLLDTLPVEDGLLAPWHEWWPAAALSELLPDAPERLRITGEIPRLERAFYDGAVPVPAGWWTRPAAYLQLSPAYDDERLRAAAWEWPVRQLDGHHLDTCVRPEHVAAALAELVRRLAPGPR